MDGDKILATDVKLLVLQAELVVPQDAESAAGEQIAPKIDDTIAGMKVMSVTTDYDLERRDKSGDTTIQAGAQVIGTINTPFGESTVQTNLPYAEVLENGHSDWAPQGVYGPTFAAIVEKYR